MVEEPTEREWTWFALMCANVFAMSISWTSFLPSLATTMTLSMGLQPGTFGAAISVYMVGSVIGMWAQSYFPLCSISPRQAVIGLLLVRIVSAILHIVATGTDTEAILEGRAEEEGEPPPQPHAVTVQYWRVCLLMVGRFAHGISVASYIVAFVWIGSFISSNARKASMIATANTIMLVGSVVGPQMGVAMEFLSLYVNPLPNYATCAPAAALPAVFTAATSAVLVVAFYFCFTDYRLRPPGGDAKGDVPELDAHARLVVAVTAFNQCLSWAGWTSYEAMLGLVIYNEYGWEVRENPRVAMIWFAFSFGLLIGAVVYQAYLKRHFSPLQIAVAKNVVLLYSAFLLVRWNHTSRPIAWSLLASGVGLLSFSEILTLNLHQMLLTLALQPAQQARYNTLVQVACQLGRVLGPVATTKLYEVLLVAVAKQHGVGVDDKSAKLRAVNVVAFVQISTLLVANVVPMLVWRRYYGAWKRSPTAPLL